MNTTTHALTGIHHVTAIASDPQENVDFYAGLLGLRLVKKTVNFDDPSAYHLYYGDASGSPGSIVTFFYWPGHAARGRIGTGQMTALTFSAPAGSLDFWRERLARTDVVAERRTRFGEDVLAFTDPDNIPVELVAVADDPRAGWTGTPGIPAAHALRGLHTAQLTVRDAAPTEALLTRDMGYTLVRREGNRARFAAAAGGSGRFVDVIADPAGAPGAGGSGTIHHIAWRVADDAGELALRERLLAGGTLVSPVRDRSYFRSIYYRERGGILFEIATDIPGFATDETAATLGTALKLPAQFEPHRAQIEAALPPLQAPRQFA
jgi:glyoxalase family protein